MRLASRSLVAPLLCFLAPVAISVAACGVPDDPPVLAIRPVIARFALPAEGATAPAFLSVPFPSDVYLEGGRFGDIPELSRVFRTSGAFLGQQFTQVNGWSRIAPALFVIDDLSGAADPDTGESATAELDRATLPADEDACQADTSSVFLVDLDAAARVPCRAIFHDETANEKGRSLLAIGPPRGVVLAEGHRYAAVLTSRVRDTRGLAVDASEDFVATVERKEGPLAAVYGPAYDTVLGVIGGALAADGARVVSLAPYTTQSITSELFAVRDELEAAPPKTLAWDEAALAPMKPAKFAKKVEDVLPDGFTASLDDWLGVVETDKKLPDGTDDPDELLPVRAHDKIAAIGTAVFEADNFLRQRPTKYDDVEHATFGRDGAGKVVTAPEAPTAKIWVTFAIPDAPMPPGGYPAVIIQHGLSSSRAYMMTLANTICKRGWVAVAIDSVTFGARANDPKFRVDEATDWEGAPGATYKGPDGFADLIAVDDARRERAGSFDLFGGLKNLVALRDQLRQAALDTTQLVKLLRAGPDLAPLTLPGGEAPRIDPERLAYFGLSLGSIEGVVAAAIEPHVKAWFFDVGGGGLLTELAAHAPNINAQLALAGALNFGFVGAQFTEAHPVVVLGQALGEGGDPIGYADRLVTTPSPLRGAATKPRNLLLIEALYDETVSNEATESLARAGGWPLATPNLGPNAGLATLAGRAPYRGGGIKLPTVDPDGAGFHDVPKAGVTALLAQVSPATHGENMTRARGGRSAKIPFHTELGGMRLERQDAVNVPCPYRELQETMVRFFADAFDGKVPTVVGLPAPAADVDGDGTPDDRDPEPVNPAAK